MFKLSPQALTLTAALALAATGALAQSAATHTVPATQTPATTPTRTIGVSPEEAREAMHKAKPQADTGTLVRTEPSAAERARDMADDAKSTATTTAKPHPGTPAPVNGAAAPQQPGHATPSHGAPAASGPGAGKNHTTTGTVTNTTTPSMAMGITGTMPGATPSNANATNTRDNAEKAPGSAASPDTMGNHSSKPAAK